MNEEDYAFVCLQENTLIQVLSIVLSAGNISWSHPLETPSQLDYHLVLFFRNTEFPFLCLYDINGAVMPTLHLPITAKSLYTSVIVSSGSSSYRPQQSSAITTITIGGGIYIAAAQAEAPQSENLPVEC